MKLPGPSAIQIPLWIANEASSSKFHVHDIGPFTTLARLIERL